MRKKKLILGVGAFLALPTVVSRGDFNITAVHTDLGAPNAITTNGNGTIAPTFQMIRFYAKNLGAAAVVENQGTKLSIVGLTMTDTGSGLLTIGGYGAASGLPASGDAADLFGQSEVSAVSGAYRFKETKTATTNAPKYVSFATLLGDASVANDNNANQLFNIVGPSPANTYGNYGYGIKSFSVTYGSTLASIGVDATTANGGLGALFAVAVVPFGDSVNVQGQLGGDAGINPTNFNLTTSVPVGDVNLDGTVGLVDLTTLLQNYNTGTTWSQGNLHGSGTTGLTDLTSLLQHYTNTSLGEVPSLAAAAVPEPVTGGLLSMLGLGFLRRKRCTA